MASREKHKDIVKQKYSEFALQNKKASACGCGCEPEEVFNIMSENYQQLEGYNPDADLGLGCGLPTKFTRI